MLGNLTAETAGSILVCLFCGIIVAAMVAIVADA